MQAYLLDTNVLSEVVKRPRGPLAVRLAGQAGLCTSVIVAYELRYGALKVRSTRLAISIEEVLSGIDVMPFETPVDTACASLRVTLEAAGTPLSGNDLLIAAHALSLGCTLVTADAAFRRVPDLRVENWLAT